MSQTKVLQTPKFTKSIIQDGRTDGYWLETFFVDPNDRVPGLLGFGLTTGDISIFDNPLNGGPTNTNGSTEWKRYIVKQFDSPVALVCGDCAGNGRSDIIACHDYGETFIDCDPKGGHITWLENPGRNKDGSVKEDWTDRYIGRWPAMHRMKAGYFTQNSIFEVIAMSVVRGPHDIESAIPVILFQKPEKSLEAVEWKRTIIDDDHYTIIHDGCAKKFPMSDGRDTLFVASRSGIDWLYYEDQKWKRHHCTDGMPKQAGKDYYGSACVDVGKIGTDPAGCILTIEPYHGPNVTALTKTSTGPQTHIWTRQVLDVYGTPEQLQMGGTGPGHYISANDYDGDGDDEFLVALMGPEPHAGVWYYKVIDVEKGIFAKWKVAEESAARIAVGDFSGQGKLDFATIVYSVPHYHEEPNPKIHLYTHDFMSEAISSDPQVVSTVWGGEPLCYVPKPTELKDSQATQLFEISGYRMDLEIIPPNSTISVGDRAAVKILFGELQDGDHIRRALNVPGFEKASSRLVSSIVTTKEEGVIFLSFTPILSGPLLWKTAQDVPVRNIFKASYAQLQLPEDLKFTKVEDLPWGEPFKGLDFWNMTGFYFRFSDKTPLCHVQFWAAAKNVSCHFHNHSEDFFLEVHMSLSPGTGNGGMWSVKPCTRVPDDPYTIKPHDFIKLPLAALEEQGRFWNVDSSGKPLYTDTGAISYPYHKWQGGNEADYMDVWAAFEFNPKLDTY